MGTNYYFVTTIGPLDDMTLDEDYNGYHIGKRSAGWQFSFRAHESVKSWRDWVALFETAKDAYIESEYGKRFDVVEFCLHVVKPSRDARVNLPAFNHYDELVANQGAYPWYSQLLPKVFKDEEGWAFSEYEFC